MIYGPTALYSLGQGALLPLLPIIAASYGADLALAALVPAALVVGQLLGNLPAGWLVSRIGERLTMLAATGGSLAAVAVMLLARSVTGLAGSAFFVGFFAAAFAVARHAFMTTRVPLRYRARALALLGGSFRLGAFTGPFVAAALLGVFGDEHAAMWCFLVVLVGVGALVWLGPDPEAAIARSAAQTRASARGEQTGSGGTLRTVRAHAGVLARLGGAAASLAAVRGARQTILPLWGVSIGMDSQTIALVIGVSGVLDFALFYVSGQVMDRFGRTWAAVPATLLMGGALLALACTQAASPAELWFGVFAVVLGVGNGLSSGILLTVGADVAPATDPASFLGAWRTITDAGGAATPLIVSGVTAAASLAVATGAVGAIGLLGALAFLRWLPRYAPQARD